MENSLLSGVPKFRQSTASLQCAWILGHLKNINFPFETNGKLMNLGVPILKHFRVCYLEHWKPVSLRIRCYHIYSVVRLGFWSYPRYVNQLCLLQLLDRFFSIPKPVKQSLDYRNCFGMKKKKNIFLPNKFDSKIQGLHILPDYCYSL